MKKKTIKIIKKFLNGGTLESAAREFLGIKSSSKGDILTRRSHPHAGIYTWMGKDNFYIGESLDVIQRKQNHLESSYSKTNNDFHRELLKSVRYRWTWVSIWDLEEIDELEFSELKRRLRLWEKRIIRKTILENPDKDIFNKLS